MDILVVGIPGPVFDWVKSGVAAACGLPAVSVQDPELLAADPAAPPQRFCATNHLTPELAQAAREGRLSVIATFDRPEDACRAIGLPHPRAQRRVAAGLYAMADLLGLPQVIQADRTTGPAALLAHCGLPAAPFPALAPEGPPDPEIAELLAPATAYARTGARVPQIWPRTILQNGDHHDQTLPRVINLTGPARNLAFGPYIGFSPGPARLAVVLAVAPTCRHAEMAIELHGSTQLGRGLFVLTQPGIFSAEINVTIPSARDALEIRLKNTRGAIEGEIGVDHVSLTPITA